MNGRSTKHRHNFSAKPYRIIDRRSSSGWSSGNTLYESSTTKTQRKQITNLDRDTSILLTQAGRRQQLTYGRWLFSNFPAVHGMVLEQANLSVGTWIPQFDGMDEEWGKKAEEWLYDWHKIMDYRGWPYDYESFVQMQVIAPLRCGDIGTMLVTNRDNYPFIQLIPAHRIGSSTTDKTVIGGRYDGYKLIDGVVLNDYAQPIAYKVWREYAGHGDYDYIPARDMMLTFFPKWPDQVRGISELAAGLSDWQDILETKWNELIAQKAAAAIALIETNETGEFDSAKGVIKTARTYDTDSPEQQLTPTYEEIAGGTVRYFKSNSGSSITTLAHNRPGQASMEFLESCMRDAFMAAEWDYYFSVNPSKVGSASMRVIVDRLMRVIKKRRRMVEKVCRRVDGWAISKAIELGLLTANDEWYMWEYQGPADITADKKYDSDVDMQEYNAGWRTMEEICGKRNMWWQYVQDQRLVEEKREIDMRREKGLPPKQQTPAQPQDNRPPREADPNQGKDDTEDTPQNEEPQ